MESSSATVVLHCRLVGGVYVGMMKSRDGVLSTGHLGWESLPWSANLSASLFPRMSTWDGTLINLMEPVCALRVSRRSSQRGTLETGPLLPVHPLSFHRRAAPVAPRKTYSLSVQIATLPKERICNARTTARSSAVLFVCRKCTGTYAEMLMSGCAKMPYPATRPTPTVSADEPSVKTRVYPSAERVSKIPSSSAARCCLRSRRAVSLRCFLLGGGGGRCDTQMGVL